MPRLLLSAILVLLLSSEARSESVNAKQWLEIKTEAVFMEEGAVRREIVLSDNQLEYLTSTATRIDGLVAYSEPNKRLLTLDATRADHLWSAIGQLRIFDWRTSYSPQDVGANIADGSFWSVSVKLGGKWMTSRGDNTYPLMTPLGEPTVDRSKGNGVQKLFELLQPFEAEAAEPSKT